MLSRIAWAVWACLLGGDAGVESFAIADLGDGV